MIFILPFVALLFGLHLAALLGLPVVYKRQNATRVQIDKEEYHTEGVLSVPNRNGYH